MKLFQKYLPAEKHFDVVGSTDMETLWETAKGELPEDTFLLAVGSLYMAGELLEYEEGLF
jgi:dihydrofolate synthase/folylpolyglutamate synthase